MVGVFVLKELTRPALAASEPWTLPKLIERTLEQNPEIRQLREIEDQKSAEKASAFSMLFPKIQADLSAQRKKDPAGLPFTVFGGDPYNFYMVGVSGSQILFDGGAAWNALKVKNLEQTRESLNRLKTERDVSHRVFELFHDVILSQRQYQILKKSKTLQESILKEIRSREKIGRSQKLDRLQVQTELALIEPQLVEALSSVQAKASELAQIAQIKADEIILDGTLDYELTTIAGEDKNPYELDLVQVSQKIADSTKSVLMSQHLPKLQLNGNIGRNSFTRSDLLGDYQTTYTLAVNLTIPLFSGLSFLQDRRIHASQEMQLQIAEARTIDLLNVERLQAKRDTVSAEERVRTSTIAFQLASESTQEALKQYRLQNIDFVQWAQIQRSQTQAAIALNQARFDWIKAVSRWARIHNWNAGVLCGQLKMVQTTGDQS